MKSEETESSRLADHEDDSQSRFRKFMESLAQRLRKDGLKLALLVLANGFYLYLGGMIFYVLERNQTIKVNKKKQIVELIETLKVTSLGNQTHLTKPGIEYNLTNSDIIKLDRFLQRMHNERKMAGGTEWTMMNSVFFASTVVTTIGYGNMAPATGFGRAFCVAYACFGIPLTIILLAKVGKILAKYINDLCGLVVRNMKRYFCADYTYDSTDGETDLNAPVWLAMLFITLFLTLDAVVFVFMENWSFGASLYFVFITLTTIGFGDLVPTNSEAVWFNVSFLYIGLAAVSITINLFIANISIQFRRHKDKFKIVQHLERELDSEDCETTPLTRDFDNRKSECETTPLTCDFEKRKSECETKPLTRDFDNRKTEVGKNETRPVRKTSRVRFQTDEIK